MKELREVRKRLSGPEAAPYMGYARKLLGMMKLQMQFNHLDQLQWVKDLPEGVRVLVQSVFGQDEIQISVPVVKLKHPFGYQRKGYIPMQHDIIVGFSGNSFTNPTATMPVTACYWRNGSVTQLPLHPDYATSMATAISKNGKVIVGAVGTNGAGFSYGGILRGDMPALWNNFGEPETIGLLPGYSKGIALDVSEDGTVVVGYCFSGSSDEAFIWNADGGIRSLGKLPGGSRSRAFAVSADGSKIAGDSEFSGAFTWTNERGMQSLGVDGIGFSLSDDGAVLAGYYINDEGVDSAFRMEENGNFSRMNPLVFNYDPAALAYGVSDDGAYSCGYSIADDIPNKYAVLWNAEGTPTALQFPEHGKQLANANAVLSNGISVGWSYGIDGIDFVRAMKWDAIGTYTVLPPLDGHADAVARDIVIVTDDVQVFTESFNP